MTGIVGALVAAALAAALTVAWLAWRSRRAELEARRRRARAQLESLYVPLGALREKALALWQEGLRLDTGPRLDWLEQAWLPHIRKARELLLEHRSLREDDGDDEALGRYLRDLRAHLDGEGDEPPYPWDVLDEARETQRALEQRAS